MTQNLSEVASAVFCIIWIMYLLSHTYISKSVNRYNFHLNYLHIFKYSHDWIAPEHETKSTQNFWQYQLFDCHPNYPYIVSRILEKNRRSAAFMSRILLRLLNCTGQFIQHGSTLLLTYNNYEQNSGRKSIWLFTLTFFSQVTFLTLGKAITLHSK